MTDRSAGAVAARKELMWALNMWIKMPHQRREELLPILDEGYRAKWACPYDLGTPERAAWIVGADRAFRDNK